MKLFAIWLKYRLVLHPVDIAGISYTLQTSFSLPELPLLCL
ncbi:MAG TPA: hypothetical protein PKC39_06715 [Ferruginibacter sp.]|nr:hypothetical protein [Ferruginibacter sp.]HMP20631.1 hypothetical protein [Ferruginibacter sp.]